MEEIGLATTWAWYEIRTAKFAVMAPLHLATTTQIFDVVTMSSEMGCIVINVTVYT